MQFNSVWQAFAQKEKKNYNNKAQQLLTANILKKII